jgi:hypothetical protein
VPQRVGRRERGSDAVIGRPVRPVEEEVRMLTRRGFGFLGIGIGVPLLLPLLALVYVVGRHLPGASTMWLVLFGLLIVAAVTAVIEIVDSIRSAGYV